MTVKELLIKILTKVDQTGLGRTKRGLKETKEGVGRVSGAFRKLKRAAGGAFKAAARSAGNFARHSLGQIRNAVVGISLAIAGAMTEFTRYNIDMARAWTMMNTGFAGWVKARREVTKMSGDLGVAKDQLSKGLYQALSAGVPEDNVMTFLRTAAKTAVADGSDVSTAVDGITTVLNAFHMDAAKAQDVTDQLFKTVANGKTTFGELASTIATAAPTAASAGMGFKEMLAATATLTKQGTPTAQAMTQIRAAILAMNKELGDGWAKSLSFQKAAELMAHKAGGSQSKLQKMTGSVEAMNAVLGLTGKNAKMAMKDLAATEKAQGSLDEAFGKVDQARHFPKMWQTVLGLVTRIGEVFDKTIKPIILEITQYIAKWRDAEGIWTALEEKLAGVRDAVQDIFTALTEGGKGGELLGGLKDMLIGGLKMGASKAVELLLKYMPLAGKALGEAAKSAWKGKFLLSDEEKAGMKDVHRRYQEAGGTYRKTLFGGKQIADTGLFSKLKMEMLERLGAEKAKRQGEKLAAGVAGELSGEEQYLKGKRTVAAVRQSGGLLRAARPPAAAAAAPSAEQQAALEEERKMERARQVLQMRLDAEKADVARVRGHIAQSGGKGSMAARTILGREQGDVARVEAALDRAADSNSKPAQAIIEKVLRFAEKVEKRNQTLAAQIKNMPI